MAIATRGNMGWGLYVAGEIVKLVEREGFDFGMEVLTAQMPELEARPDFSDRLEVLIAGRSEAGGFQHHWFTNFGNYGMEACVLRRGKQWEIFAPTRPDGKFGAAIAGVPPVKGYTPIEYIYRYGAKIMQHVREQKAEKSRWSAADECPYIVGGLVDMTIVNADGAVTGTIHRWPEDRVGQVIDPFAHPWNRPGALASNVTPITAGNRQQRRAAERAAKAA